MTKGELLTRVGQLLGDTSAATRTLLSGWVGHVLQEIALLARVPLPRAEWSATTVAGQRAMSLPSDAAEVDSLRIPALDRVLVRISEDEFDKLLVEAESEQGDPTYWTLSRDWTTQAAGQIKLHPVPDDEVAITLRGRANFAALTDDDTELELADDYTMAAVWGLYRVAARFDNSKDVGDVAAAFGTALAAMRFAYHGSVSRITTVAPDNLPSERPVRGYDAEE